MYSNPLSDLFTLIVMIVIFIAIVSFCCSTDNTSSGSSKTSRNTTTRKSTTNTNYRNNYSECPACGSPYYDGYCEECGYPDINQGWLGENG